MNSKTPYPILALWAVPRSVSTAFERMMAARGDFIVLNEPFSAYYYFSIDRVNYRFSQSAPLPNSGFKAILESILATAEENPVFFKDMAYHLRDQADKSFLSRFTNALLIRHPQWTLPSLYRKMPDFTFEETGYERLYQLFQLLTTMEKKPPAVIDGEELRKYPHSLVAAYCQHMEIAFRPEALQWEKGAEAHWKRWHDWFSEAASSTGFRGPVSLSLEDRQLLETPPIAAVYDQCLYYYERMAAHRIVVA